MVNVIRYDEKEEFYYCEDDDGVFFCSKQKEYERSRKYISKPNCKFIVIGSENMDDLKKQLETNYEMLNKDIKSYMKHRRLERMLIAGISAFFTVIVLRLIF